MADEMIITYKQMECICDKFCKYPEKYGDSEDDYVALIHHCDKCPLSQLRECE